MTAPNSPVLVVANLMKDDARRFSGIVRSTIESYGLTAIMFAFSGEPGSFSLTGNEVLAVSLGGDGTVLFTARMVSQTGIPLLPVNLGNLGFIAGIQRAEWKACFERWMQGKLPVSRRLMLRIHVFREENTVATFTALNDAVVSAQCMAKVIDLAVSVGGAALGKYRSDGLIVATPTGSTAYNLAAGGPAMQPEMDAIIINPICPFTLSIRPLVVPGDASIEIEVEKSRRTGTMLTIDGQETFLLQAGDRIRCERATRDALIHTLPDVHFYQLLRSKLAWSGGPDA